MRLLHLRADLFGRRLCAGGTREGRGADSGMDERQPLPLRGVSQHRRRHQRSAGQDGRGGVNPFSYSRATDWQAAVHDIAGDARAKFLGGGTNLVDLMKMGVEAPARLIDINRLPLAEVEELPNDAGVRIGALVRNSDLAEHPLVTARYPVLSEALLSGASPQLRNLAT